MSIPSPATRLILASGSRYRRLMLERLHYPFDVIPADIDESPRTNENGTDLAQRLAEEKARVIAAQHPGSVIIGCDQVAVCRDRILGKPGTADRALEQLRFTAGHEVTFHSAMTLCRDSKARHLSVPTRIQMRRLPDAVLEAYIERDQPLDCAGSMRSESLGSLLTESIRSDDPSALIGLPLIGLNQMLLAFGIDLLAPP